MSPPRGRCEFCGALVHEHEKAAFRIRGWEVERDQGGANRILGRERQPNRIVHARCVEHHFALERHGIAGGQLQL
jgi:hypothetical protein